jgi:hypothetical protein
MGHTKESTQAMIEREISKTEGFACPYCSESYESREKRDRCHASHFQDTNSISKPRSDRTRHRNKNIVEEWKK